MKGRRHAITSWRTYVDGMQIGSGYTTENQALEVALDFIKHLGDESSHLTIEIKPSYAPIWELV